MVSASLSPTPNSNLKLPGGVVIVGAGCGGLEAAMALRANGWSGRIDVFDQEKDWPYHKPPLSKGFLKGSTPEAELSLRSAELLNRESIDLHLGSRVDAIDPRAKMIHLGGDISSSYSHLVLALGGQARPLNAFADAAPKADNVYHLRDFQDCLKMRDALRQGARMAIVGGGFIGLEVAATARELGLHVSVFESAPRLLARTVGPAVSISLESLHRSQGVDIHTSVTLEGIEVEHGNGRVRALRFSGITTPCDMVVIAVGQEPVVDLAQSANLAVDNGILVDGELRTSDSRIFAIGDCARFWSSRYDNTLRLESVPNALDHARRAAAAICGKPPAQDAVPWFWTDQFDTNLKMAGLAGPGDAQILRGSVGGAFSTIYLRDGRVTAIHSINRPADFMGGRKLIETGTRVSPEALADESRPLMKLATAGVSV